MALPSTTGNNISTDSSWVTSFPKTLTEQNFSQSANPFTGLSVSDGDSPNRSAYSREKRPA